MKGYRSYTKGKQLQEALTEFYEAQGALAKDKEQERMNNYAKPGTSAHKRQAKATETSFPESRYRSRRP